MEEQQKLQAYPYYWGFTPEEDYYELQGIRGSKAFFTSPTGIKLFTRSWLPLTSPPRALVFMIHGYGNNISWTFQATPIFLAQMGFACFALDLEGHGESQGLKAYVPKIDHVVEDCLSFFDFIKQNPEFQKLKSFLYGESMGGAISLLSYFADPKGFDGAILVAPMCKISDNLRPRWPIPQILTLLVRFFPTWAIVPTSDLMYKSVKVDEKKVIAEMNPARYRGKPRLGTAVELLRVVDYLNQRLGDVNLPFIVLHGNADVVTDPNVSRELHEKAKSGDKSIRVYEGMMHSLLFGETDENVEIVRSDILSWLDVRCNNARTINID
ncbi:hypothetical protein L6164_032799 [Bauhinia variegata]|uniref:Uncharacterized protein n=1 Tax=Bauhinia variegata TaxID=167791 RepID=A0ACB9KQF9_BAUVA|nr:hypothetical protein L6164_032799 [Bauhinia variegata]